MSVPNPLAGAGKATGSPAIKVFMWLSVLAGCLQTVRQWWNGEAWFMIELLDYLWGWALKLSEAIQ